MRGLARLIGVLVAAALLASCGGGSTARDGEPTEVGADIDRSAEAGEPQPGGLLVVGLAAETNGWNPYQGQWSASSFLVANAVFDPLAVFDDEGEAHPYLAESFTPNDEFTSWDIGLRPDVTFHDGSPVDAAAIARNLETGRTSGLTSAAFAAVSGIEVVDPLTVRVTMSQPYSTFPLLLSGQPGFMAAPSQLDRGADASLEPVGSGPFRFVEWEPDAALSVERNDDYWREGLPHLDAVEFRVLIDSTSRLNALAAGEVHAIEVTTAESIVEAEEWAQANDGQFTSDVGLETDELVITLNTAAPPFDDPRARQAVAAAIDRDALSALGGGAFPPAWGPLAEGSPGYLSPEEAGNVPFDPEAAAELAAEYERDTGEPLAFELIVPTDPSLAATSQMAEEQLVAAGMDATLRQTEQTALITQVLSGDYQASAFALFSTPSLDRAYSFIATEPPASGLGLNIARFFDPELTAAMDAARATGEAAEQQEAYGDVQRRLAAENQIVFFAHRIRAIAYDGETFGLADTTVPGVDGQGTDEPANAGFYSSPFLTTVWRTEG